ncbi:MAG: cell division protein FtsA [bacterium]
MKMPPIAALEIGTSRTVVCVGEASENGRMKITGIGNYPTTGVRKGQVIDLSQARVGVEAAAADAEKMSGVDVWQVLMTLSGGHVQSTVNHGQIPIRSSDRVVTREDVEEVTAIANEMPLEADRQVLHTIRQTYTLDDQPGIVTPQGMRCNMLSFNTLVVHGHKNRIENVVNVAKNARLDVTDVTFSGVCAALAVLTPEQKKNGVVLVDFGGGTTNYVAYTNGIVSSIGSIAVGGDHITNDIALAFNIPLYRAEELKRNEGSAIIETGLASGRLSIPADVGFEDRTISCKALHIVINARMEETLKILRSRLDEAGVLIHLGAGVVLTGGGAYLRKLSDLTQRTLGIPCQIGLPINVDGLIDHVEQPASFSTVAGLVIYGQKTYEDNGFLSPIRKLFGKVFNS